MYTTRKNNNKKKVFLVLPNLTIGGAEKVYLEIVNNIDINKFKVYLIVFSSEDNILGKFVKEDVEVINLKKKSVKLGTIKFFKYLFKYKPDIVMSSIIHLNIAMAVLKIFFPKRTKLICRNSNLYSEIIKLTKYPNLTNYLYKLFYKNFDFYIFISREQKNDFLNLFPVPNQKTKVINNPLNFSEIILKSNDKYEEDLFIKDGFNFVVCGSIKYQKGIDILIDAVNNLKEKKFKVLILGGGFKARINEMKNKIYNLSLEKKIVMVGRVENVFPYFKRSDAIIIPSRFEGCCNVLIEALCLKKPIICTPAPGLAKELIENAKGVFMSSKINSESLSLEINNFLNNKTKESFSEKIYKANIDYGIKEYENVFLNL